MLIGRVIGEVWATQKDPKMANFKFLAVSPIDKNRQPTASFIVAVDSVGAGPGELVLVTQGSSARQSKETEGKPVDAVVMAIVDDIHLEDRNWQEFDGKSMDEVSSK